MAPVKFSDLLNGFESASFGGSLENMAYIGLDAGEVHLVSGEIELEDKVPDDIDTSDRPSQSHTRENSPSLRRHIATKRFSGQRCRHRQYGRDLYDPDRCWHGARLGDGRPQTGGDAGVPWVAVPSHPGSGLSPGTRRSASRKLRTRSICSEAIKAGAWPMPGSSTS